MRKRQNKICKRFNKKLGTSKREQGIITHQAPQNLKKEIIQRSVSDDLSDLEDVIGVPENEKLFKRNGGEDNAREKRYIRNY